MSGDKGFLHTSQVWLEGRLHQADYLGTDPGDNLLGRGRQGLRLERRASDDLEAVA